MTQFHMTGPLGESITLTVETQQDMHEQQRAWGKKGWTPGTGDVPAGGFTMPYCMADTFDWAMIGATKITVEGEEIVLHRGHAYKRRDFEAQTTGKKMPAAVKYSRGAKPTDPAHLREGDADGVQYVTLIIFKGRGQAIPHYEMPREQARPAPRVSEPETPATRTYAPTDPIGPERARKLHSYLGAALKGSKYQGTAGNEQFIRDAIGQDCPRHWEELTDAQFRLIYRQLKASGYVQEGAA